MKYVENYQQYNLGQDIFGSDPLSLELVQAFAESLARQNLALTSDDESLITKPLEAVAATAHGEVVRMEQAGVAPVVIEFFLEQLNEVMLATVFQVLRTLNEDSTT